MFFVSSARLLIGLLLLTPALGGCTPTTAGGSAGTPGDRKSETRASSRSRRAQTEDVWAIRCVTLTGPQRFKLADGYAGLLRKVPELKSKLVQVFHEGEETNVYYGEYRRKYSQRTDKETFKPDPLNDMALIRVLSMEVTEANGVRRPVWPFRLATLATLPTGGGLHPEWQLANAPGYYSLQVGVFYNSGEMRSRKFAAEEYCRVLREQGEEAYYHHGEVNSSVCIGAFPEAAIETVQRQDPYTGIIKVTARIVDERMLALQRKYPHNLHNGATFYEVLHDPQDGHKIRVAHTSFAVEIPKKSTAIGGLGG